MNAKNNKKVRPGVALLVVLFVVMAITILSLGFVSRSDVELACGQNMILRTEMDYLAESGLEHARGLILNPQDVSTEFWTGGTGLQLASGSDFYDVRVDRDANDFCNYIINCNSYRRAPDGSDIGRSSLRAELRLDPCIAYWVGSDTIIPSQVVITGDVYCDGTLTNNGDINGDVFAVGSIGGINPEGQKKPAADVGVVWPNLLTSDFGPTHYYIGLTQYQTQLLDPNNPLNPSDYPAGVYYSIGDVNMPGGVTINGTLVVSGDLTISGANNTIVAYKSFPALVVNGQLRIEQSGQLTINGLAQVESMFVGDDAADITILGALFVNSGLNVSPVYSGNIKITADPAIASIETWPDAGVPSRWSPAPGAFFRSIERK